MERPLFNGKDFVRIADAAGNRLACPIHNVSDPNNVSIHDLKYCVPDDTAGRFDDR